MASLEAVKRRRANRKSARAAKIAAGIAKQLRQRQPAGDDRLSELRQQRETDAAWIRHEKAWNRFRRLRANHPRYAPLAADRRLWEAWVAMLDISHPKRREWFFKKSEDTRWHLCRMGREVRASARRFRLAKLSVRQRFDSIQKGRKYELV